MTTPQEKLEAKLAEACVLLGLAPPFTPDQAKMRFRELAKLYHPDAGLAKNSSHFAQLSHAYDLIEANADRLASMKLTLAHESSASSTKVADLLQQLHQARAQSVKTEKALQDRTAELQTLRQFVSGHRGNSLKRTAAIILFSAATLFLGFLAGMVWSAQSPIVPLIPPGEYMVSLPTLSGPVYAQIDPTFGLSGNVTMHPDGEYGVTLTTGSVELTGKGAELRTSATLRVIKMPQFSMSGTLVTPTPQPTFLPQTPTPTTEQPVQTPIPPPSIQLPTTTAPAQITTPPAPTPAPAPLQHQTVPQGGSGVPPL